MRLEYDDRHNNYMIPLDQVQIFLVFVNYTEISREHDFVISQSEKQRKVIVNSTKLSIDNNHKASPPWAERTLSIRAYLHGGGYSLFEERERFSSKSCEGLLAENVHLFFPRSRMCFE